MIDSPRFQIKDVNRCQREVKGNVGSLEEMNVNFLILVIFEKNQQQQPNLPEKENCRSNQIKNQPLFSNPENSRGQPVIHFNRVIGSSPFVLCFQI